MTFFACYVSLCVCPSLSRVVCSPVCLCVSLFTCLFVCLFVCLERSITESGSFSFAYAVVSTALVCAVSHVLSHPQFAIQLGRLKTVYHSAGTLKVWRPGRLCTIQLVH